MSVQIRLILSTIALTALIWTYADQASQETYTASAVPVKLMLPQGGNYSLQLENSPDGTNEITVDLTFRGARSRISALRASAERNQLKLPLRIPENLNTGQRETLDLASALRDLQAIKSRGVQLQTALPAEVTLTLSRYRQVPVEITLDAGAYKNRLTSEQPTFAPAKVLANVLATDLSADETLPPLVVDIESAIDDKLKAGANTHEPLTFAVPLKNNWLDRKVIFEPAKITVTCSIRTDSALKTITLIPLDVRYPAYIDMSGYVLEWSSDKADLLQSVEVSGPAVKIEKLDNEKVKAEVQIEASDLPSGDEGVMENLVQKTVEFRLPQVGYDGVEILSTAPQVKVTIRIKPDGDPTIEDLLPLPAP